MLIPPVEIDHELQRAFCQSSLKCVDGPCTGCVYDKSNFEAFVHMLQDVKAPKFIFKKLHLLSK